MIAKSVNGFRVDSEDAPRGTSVLARDDPFHSLRRYGEPDWSPPEKLAERGLPTLRQTFVLVQEFRMLSARGQDRERLRPILAALILFARRGMTLAEESRAGEALFREDNARCLHDLESLLRDLQNEHAPSAHDLLHALDALILWLVRSDSASTPSRTARRARLSTSWTG